MDQKAVICSPFNKMTNAINCGSAAKFGSKECNLHGTEAPGSNPVSTRTHIGSCAYVTDISNPVSGEALK